MHLFSVIHVHVNVYLPNVARSKISWCCLTVLHMWATAPVSPGGGVMYVPLYDNSILGSEHVSCSVLPKHISITVNRRCLCVAVTR